MAVAPQKFREVVFQLLYAHDLGRGTDDDMLNLIAQELELSKKNVKEAQARVHLVLAELDKIDALIAKTSHSYAFERIQTVERNILRLGVYELLNDPLVPNAVAIAEALRLARKFSTKESALFVNAILDAIHKSMVGEKPDEALLSKSIEALVQVEEVSEEAAKNSLSKDREQEK